MNEGVTGIDRLKISKALFLSGEKIKNGLISVILTGNSSLKGVVLPRLGENQQPARNTYTDKSGV